MLGTVVGLWPQGLVCASNWEGWDPGPAAGQTESMLPLSLSDL